MGTVYRIDQETWSVMRMVKDAAGWCEDRNQDGSRSGSIREHKRVLNYFIQGVREEAA